MPRIRSCADGCKRATWVFSNWPAYKVAPRALAEAN